MVRVVGIDHLVISVGDFAKSKSFYAPLMKFLGVDVEAEYEGSMMGWANGNTLFWIAAADAEGRKHTYRKAISAFTTTPSVCATAPMSMRCRHIWKSRARPSSIQPANITTTTMRCSFSTLTA